MTDPRAMAMASAYDAGASWAKNLQRGDRFDGCAPAGALAYPGDNLLIAMFTNGAMDVLNTVRLFTVCGYITRLDRLETRRAA